jgi:hypothetical protein
MAQTDRLDDPAVLARRLVDRDRGMAQADRQDDPVNRIRRLVERDRSEAANVGSPSGAAPEWSDLSPEARDNAVKAAARAEMPIGQWLERAIRTQSEHEDQRGQTSDPTTRAPVDLTELERLVALAGQIAAAGDGMPQSVRREANAVITARLKACRAGRGRKVDKAAGRS